MTSKGSKLPAGQGRASTPRYKEMFDHFKDQMATISFDVADLCMDLHKLRQSFHLWEAAFAAAQDSLAKPSKKRPRSAKPRTSSRQPASRS